MTLAYEELESNLTFEAVRHPGQARIHAAMSRSKIGTVGTTSTQPFRKAVEVTRDDVLSSARAHCRQMEYLMVFKRYDSERWHKFSSMGTVLSMGIAHV